MLSHQSKQTARLWQILSRCLPLTVFCVGCVAPSSTSWSQNQGATLTPAQVDRIGQRIWQNECGGKVSGLTSWNTGEQFASLGIGHFIWYPAGQRGPFEESFPPLLSYLKQRGVTLPGWLNERLPCPWPDRSSFLADSNGQRQNDLRTLLAATVRPQTEFIMQRSRRALPTMLSAAPAGTSDRVQHNYDALAATPSGMFALIDYVNFKGEGGKRRHVAGRDHVRTMAVRTLEESGRAECPVRAD